MNIASFIVQVRFCASLHTMLKLSTLLMTCVVRNALREGALRCSLNHSPTVPADSPIYSSSHSTLSYFYLSVTLLICRIVSLSLRDPRRFLMVLHPLKYTCVQCLLQIFFKLSLSNLV